MEPTQPSATQPYVDMEHGQVELSQPHSLWSEEMGDVQMSDPVAVQFGKPQTLLQVALPMLDTLTSQEIAAVKVEGLKKAAARKKHDSDFESDSDDDTTASSTPRIAVNPKAEFKIKVNLDARKSGRKRKIMSQVHVEEAIENKRFNSAESTRREMDVITLEDFVAAMEKDKPSLSEASIRLRGVNVKYQAHEDKRPQYKRMKNPLLNVDAFYVLPARLLEATKIPAHSRQHPAAPLHAPVTEAKAVEVIAIKNVGTFSRAQIEAMMCVATMKEEVQSGLDACKWLQDTVAPAVPAHLLSTVTDTATNIMATYPSTPIPGLNSCSSYVYAILYRTPPPTYLNDALITATCTRVQAIYPKAGFVHRSVNPARETKSAAVRGENARVKAITAQDGVDWVFLPINFENVYWCGILVSVKEKLVYTYDQLNQTDYRAVKRQAENLLIPGLPGYQVKEIESPVQQDFYSCGLFVAWAFYRAVEPKAPTDMSKGSALTRRRFELFYFVMTGYAPLWPPVSKPHPSTSPVVPAKATPLTQDTVSESSPAAAAASVGGLTHLLEEFDRVEKKADNEDKTPDTVGRGSTEDVAV